MGVGWRAQAQTRKGRSRMPILGSRMPDYPRSGGNGAKRLRKRTDTDSAPPLNVGDVGDELIATIALVLLAGGAIHLGMTTDGGALLVRAWIGGDKYEDYVTASVELTETLEALRGEAEGARHVDPPKRPNGRRNGS